MASREIVIKLDNPALVYQEIVEGQDEHRCTLYLADECKHVQWMSDGDLETGLDSVHCDTCRTYGIRKTWRRVYVKA